MFYRYFNPFVQYFTLANFAKSSIEAIAARGKEFNKYLVSNKIRSIKKRDKRKRQEGRETRGSQETRGSHLNY